MEEDKQKCFKIIESCVTYEHFIGAVRIIDLFYKKFKTVHGYNELYHRLVEVRNEKGIYLQNNKEWLN